MAKILNCASVTTAKESIAEIFGVTTMKIEDFFINFGDYTQPHIKSDYIYERFLQSFGEPLDFQVIYFHGTRIANIDSFKTKGILPLNQVVHQIETELTLLAQQHKFELVKPFSFYSHYTKRLKNEPGPMGFLCRESLMTSSYTDCPEVIDDLIKSSISVEHDTQFKQFFQNHYKPYIIWFVETPEAESLKQALYYAYTGFHNPEDAVDNDCSAFNAKGKIIEPEKIHQFEPIHYENLAEQNPSDPILIDNFSLKRFQ